MYYLIN